MEREQIFYFIGKEFVFGSGMSMVSETRIAGKNFGSGDEIFILEKK